jgi:hypothetical protein
MPTERPTIQDIISLSRSLADAIATDRLNMSILSASGETTLNDLPDDPQAVDYIVMHPLVES